MAGSRDESTSEHGLAHFVEHTIFKGTARRKSHHIINRMESVGGELNAYTTKEETLVYTLSPAHNTVRSVGLIADLVVNASFPAAELDKEREVIIDEICSYLDTPDAAVYDDFEDMIFEGSSLGHNILGTKRSVNKFTTTDCKRWVADNYHVGRMAFFYTGPATLRQVVAALNAHMGALPVTGSMVDRESPAMMPSFDRTRTLKSHQAHTVMGCRMTEFSDRCRDAGVLCNNILGGPGMNSMFNVALRERRGLVYTVDSSITRLTDGAMWSVYFGCDAEHVSLCKELIAEQIHSLATIPLKPRSLNMAKRQLLGQLTLSRSGIENTSLALGRSVLRGETFRTPEQLLQDINRLTSDDIMTVVSDIERTGLSSLTFK